MVSSDQDQRKHPPDRPKVGQEGGIPSMKLDMEGEQSLPNGLSKGTEMGNLEDNGTKGKLQKRDGAFSGEASLINREEDWMNAHNVAQEQESQNKRSYREAVKPKGNSSQEQVVDQFEEEDWDGNLLLSNIEEMERGVTIQDTDQGPHIKFSEVEKKRLKRKWQRALIIKLLGGNIGYMQLSRRIQRMWARSGKVDLSVIGNGFFLANFKSWEDYYFALEGGPWLIQNHYLTVQTWKSNFNPGNELIQKLAIWVRLPGLPVDCYDKKFFFSLGNKIGKAIKVDDMTLYRARTLYARMCVEIDLGKPLLPAYTVDGNSLKIEYEGLHLICFKCGKFGHAADQCPTKNTKKQNEESIRKENERYHGEEVVAGKNGESTSHKFGEWMVVPEPRRGRKGNKKMGKTVQGQKKDIRVENKQEHTSRFAAL